MNAAARPISRADIEAKMRQLQGEVDSAKGQATSYVIVVGAVAAVAVVGIAFFVGRRRGRARTTVVEVRRL